MNHSSGGLRPKTPVLCPRCLGVPRAQRTEYDLRCNWYVCLVHGPVLTGEYLANTFPQGTSA